MAEFVTTGLLVLTVLMVGAIASLTVAAIVTERALDRRNRVVATVRSLAPTSWLWSPAPLAVLHRRIRAATLLARSACPPLGRRQARTQLHELADDIDGLAVQLDARLCAARLAPRRQRRRSAALVLDDIRTLESAAARIAELGRLAVAPAEPPELGFHRLHERLDAIEAARAEVDALDQLCRVVDRSRQRRAG